MKKTRHTTDQIIEKLRQADVALGKGQKVPEVCKSLEITEKTYYRWRQKYGGVAPEMARQRAGLEKGKSRLKKLGGVCLIRTSIAARCGGQYSHGTFFVLG